MVTTLRALPNLVSSHGVNPLAPKCLGTKYLKIEWDNFRSGARAKPGLKPLPIFSCRVELTCSPILASRSIVRSQWEKKDSCLSLRWPTYHSRARRPAPTGQDATSQKQYTIMAVVTTSRKHDFLLGYSWVEIRPADRVRLPKSRGRVESEIVQSLTGQSGSGQQLFKSLGSGRVISAREWRPARNKTLDKIVKRCRQLLGVWSSAHASGKSLHVLNVQAPSELETRMILTTTQC